MDRFRQVRSVQLTSEIVNYGNKCSLTDLTSQLGFSKISRKILDKMKQC